MHTLTKKKYPSKIVGGSDIVDFLTERRRKKKKRTIIKSIDWTQSLFRNDSMDIQRNVSRIIDRVYEMQFIFFFTFYL